VNYNEGGLEAAFFCYVWHPWNSHEYLPQGVNMDTIFQVAFAVIGSVGGAAVIIAGLSSWLGKVWAERLMAKEKAQHDRELEGLRSELRIKTEQQILEVNHWFSIQKETFIKHHNDKLDIYRSVTDMLSEIIRELEAVSYAGKPPSAEIIEKFYVTRLRAYGYLAMLAPQSVMDQFDILIDNLLDILVAGKKIPWSEIRKMALNLLNAAREDIGLSDLPIQYNGHR